ncbi:helix-turn-helix domain-containing protein [Parafilimonas sp.]|uniref:AlbA family DNA-binding domain-containing protein n=1 Tax=Parafilimonas sp. TaxID=1969739 RepID=UPI0039E71D3F
MDIARIKRLLREKENIHLEFKEAAMALPGNLFETICAMLNREGGSVLLGVDDNGNVTGVSDSAVSKMITDLVNLSNNPQKLDPPFILFPQVYTINGYKLIHIQVPASSQVHKTAKIIYDRSNDGDFKVEQPHLIAEIANRKRNHYTEGIIYPALQMEDFKHELFQKVRNLIRSNNPAHPWLALNDRQMMEISGLWKKDYLSGQEGFTLAACLLLGKDAVIQQIISHYKIDALVKVNNTERYDDRIYTKLL